MEVVEFRGAVLEDFEKLAEFRRDIHRMHLEHARNFYKEVRNPLTLEGFQEILAGKDHQRAYVLVEGGQPVAYAFTKVVEIKSDPIRLDQKVFFIDDMYVEGQRRHSGYGRQLMQELRQTAVRLGCGSIALEVWEWNKGARAFYNALGFRTTQTRMKLWI